MARVSITWRGDAATTAVRQALAAGLNRAAERLAALSTPLVPYLDGDLTDSQDIHQATAATVEQGAQVQYDTPYAVYQHEGGDGTRTVTNYSHTPHPNAQAHFLSAPLAANAHELQQIIAATMRGAL